PLHDPIRLAEDAATVDQLSDGRLTVGLGIAWREEEFRMFGVPFGERLPRTLDTVEILRRAWTGERFSFDGRVFHYEDVRVTPPPRTTRWNRRSPTSPRCAMRRSRAPQTMSSIGCVRSSKRSATAGTSTSSSACTTRAWDSARRLEASSSSQSG